MADKNALFLSFNTEPLPTESYSKEYRVGSILAQILLSNSRVYPQYFAESFYVSRSTIDKDLQEVNKWLEGHHLQLSPKRESGFICRRG